MFFLSDLIVSAGSGRPSFLDAVSSVFILSMSLWPRAAGQARRAVSTDAGSLETASRNAAAAFRTEVIARSISGFRYQSFSSTEGVLIFGTAAAFSLSDDKRPEIAALSGR